MSSDHKTSLSPGLAATILAAIDSLSVPCFFHYTDSVSS